MLRPVLRVGVISLVATACLLAGCGSGASHALYSSRYAWGSGTSRDAVGEVWAATGIPLCTKGHTPVTLTSIQPVAVRGQVHFDRILVKKGSWDEDALYQGTPPGSRPVAGFVIPSPSPCAWPSRSDPVYEAIVLADRTGPQGGSVAGLRVHYRVGHAAGVYTVRFTFELCGKHGSGICHG